MEFNEVTYTLKDTLNAAQLVLDQAIIQQNGVGVFTELGFGYADAIRMYVTDDSSRLTSIAHKIERDGRTYFLGSAKK